ncbi:two-component system histidine kinase PnpS [Sporolactobacillus spathodeae]|uniref:histidine kinase n=1 Tax=Sporolactobacillus spathodeae TaxID=1465502 RepID=A0ABS2QAE6_9BACL|nr:ATP-binding protein [Sporolactobacillus spathodeae]MBM7658720.1 two-component system phosphate regulon sensor histidine kinase PhoR [Sporolactobacillus spathodeae]
MKNRRVEWQIILRWVLVIVLLLFVLSVSEKVIELSCQHQDRLAMENRWEWIRQVILASGTNSQINAELANYAAKEHIKITRYQKDGTPVFTTDAAGDKTILGLKGTHPPIFQEKGDHSLYIGRLYSNQKSSGYLLIQGRRTKIVGLELLYILLFLGGLSIVYFRERLDRSYTEPIRFAAQMAESSLNGKYHLIASDNAKHEDVLHMNLNLNRLTEKMSEMDRSLSRQRRSMGTLIENIGNGLLLIDGNHRISYVNKAFKEIFNTEAAHWLMADYEWAIPYDGIKILVRKVFADKARVTEQMQLTVGINRLYFDVSAAPVLDYRSRVQSIVVVFHDITALKKLESMRRDFVANVSHELRTPITSIIGFTETLLDGAREDRQSEEQFLNIILLEGQRLKSLVSDLLDLSKIEREHFELDWQDVSLSELLDTVLLIFKEKAESKHITVKRLSGPAGNVVGDSFRIRQIMINLINNAIAYTPEHGSITITVEETKTTAGFTVSDTGIGIATDQIPRIFERFYRVDKARSRDSGGTGLGLAIVKHLVEAHHGRIHVTSQLGQGTTFTITFNRTLA